MRLDQNLNLLRLPTGMRVDLFACWFLTGSARSENIGLTEDFGFRSTYNGIGIFLYKEG